MPLALPVAAVLAGCAAKDPNLPANTVPGSPAELRFAAEWEPALGVLVCWPPFVPHQLLVETAQDSRLYVLVGDGELTEEARLWFRGWGIDLNRVEFLKIPGGDDHSPPGTAPSGWNRAWDG